MFDLPARHTALRGRAPGASAAGFTRDQAAGLTRDQAAGFARDQAAGLRRLFAAPSQSSRVRFVALLSNPHVAFGGVMIERLVAAFAELDAHTLVVDAAEDAPAPRKIAGVNLAAAVEPLSRHASCLAARGLPRRHLDAGGPGAAWLQALAAAAPQAKVVLLHAGAADLASLFAPCAVRLVVLAGDGPAALLHAYAGIKLLASCAGLTAFDSLLAAAPRSSERIAARLASCAEIYLGATQHDWAPLDPAADADRPPSAALHRVALDLLRLLPTAMIEQPTALN